MKYAYIFDFDGVLVNTMEAHFDCYKQALAEAGVGIDKKQFYSQAGMKGVEQIQFFADVAGIAVNAEQIYKRKKEIWSQQEPDVVEIESNLALLRLLRSAGYPTAIATGSSPGSIDPIMKEHNIEIDAAVTSLDVERGKPYPDLFLCAAQRLGVEPEYCIVIEDSDAGIEAAKAAGMKSMRFYDNI